MNTITFDESKDHFDEFVNNYETYKSLNMSESDTRSKLIDTVLIDVLGWNEADIRREGHVDSGYFDYKISIAGLSLIIEAKRQYNDLKLPNQNKRKCKLNAIYSSNQDVIDQIRHYLDDCGCDIGIITNGKQYIIAKFINTNGIPWKENNCIVYNGVEDIINNYVEFWNTLSLFRDTPPKLNEVVKAVNSDSISHQITNEIESFPSQSSNSATPKPIIIIGSRGAGKTTFLNFLFKNESDGKNLQDNPYLFVNLMKYYTGADCVDFENIYKDLLSQFSDKYPQFNINSLEVLERIYIREINQNKKGVWRYSFENNQDEYQKELALFFKEKMRNSQDHFMAINKYLTREIHKRIVVIFDNADQLSDKIQEQVYLMRVI